MKLSKRALYGTRLMLDMARHYQKGPVRLGSIAERQHISVKFLEQIIIPLKMAAYVQSVRGPKGGHMLAKPPDQVTVGEVVELLEGGPWISECTGNPAICERSALCPTRLLWKEATEAMLDRLRATTFADLLERWGDAPETQCLSPAQKPNDRTA